MELIQTNFIPMACIFKHCDPRTRRCLLRTSKRYKALEEFIIVKMNCKNIIKNTCKKLNLKKISIRDLSSVESINEFCKFYLKYIYNIPSSLTKTEFNQIQSNFDKIDRGRIMALYNLTQALKSSEKKKLTVTSESKDHLKNNLIVIGKKPHKQIASERPLDDFGMVENKQKFADHDSVIMSLKKSNSKTLFSDDLPSSQILGFGDLMSIANQYQDPLIKFDFLLSNIIQQITTDQAYKAIMKTIGEIKCPNETRIAINRLIQTLAIHNISILKWKLELESKLSHL